MGDMPTPACHNVVSVNVISYTITLLSDTAQKRIEPDKSSLFCGVNGTDGDTR